jgi:hypothetical protein
VGLESSVRRGPHREVGDSGFGEPVSRQRVLAVAEGRAVCAQQGKALRAAVVSFFFDVDIQREGKGMDVFFKHTRTVLKLEYGARKFMARDPRWVHFMGLVSFFPLSNRQG